MSPGKEQATPRAAVENAARNCGGGQPLEMSRSVPLRLATCLLALAVAVPARAAAIPKPTTLIYTVKKGDTLSGLAAHYLLGPGAARLVQRLNHIADPRHMRAGLGLRVPTRLLRQEPILARIRNFSGRIVITSGNRTLTAAPGMVLAEGNTIETSANAFISIGLPDNSVITMPSQSRITVTRLRRTLLTGSVERDFKVGVGRMRAVVTPMTDPQSSFRITTPVAVSAVRGTEFRVGYNEALNSATTEVIKGKVEVSGARKSDVMVAAGFGTTASAGSGVSAPLTLLPAPQPADQTSLQRDVALTFLVKPVAGALAYRLQIARDAGFLDVLTEAESTEPHFTLASFPDGVYFSRISAVDAAGFEGRSDVYGFERRLHAVEASMDVQKRGRRRDYNFRWQDRGSGRFLYRFRLSRCDSPAVPVIDQGNVRNLGLVVSDLPLGEYCWSVQSISLGGPPGDAVWSDMQKFTIMR